MAWTNCWKVKKHYGGSEKACAVAFVRLEVKGLQRSAWVLGLKISTLSEWNQLFDEKMTPLVMPDERGKTGKVTVETVRKITAIAKDMRDKDRCTLSYFFGILKRIQKEMDEQKHKDYCCKRYNENQMMEREWQKHQEMMEAAQPTAIEDLAAMLQEIIAGKACFIRETGIRVVKQMLQNLKNQYRYAGILKKKISDALRRVQSLSLSQRQEAFNLVEQYLL